MNILAIGAHPDDIELGCGGSLLKASQHEHNVFMYTLTNGSKSGDPQKRIEEVIHSAKFIGARKLWIDRFEDSKVYLIDKLINHIEFITRKSKADIIYTHSIHDVHHDHRAIAEGTLEGGRFVPTILSYEMPVTKDFKPQVYNDITDVIDDKINLINFFISQKEKIFLTSNAIRGLAQYRALQSRLGISISAVESFEVVKLGFGDNFRLISSDNTDNTTEYYCTDAETHFDEIVEYVIR
jgi:LmbE family N-acetylglucosaminyl deacetylase